MARRIAIAITGVEQPVHQQVMVAPAAHSRSIAARHASGYARGVRFVLALLVLHLTLGCAGPARIDGGEAGQLRAALDRAPSSSALIAARRGLLPALDRGVARAAWTARATTGSPRDDAIDALAALRATLADVADDNRIDLRPSRAPSAAEVSVEQFWDDTRVQGCGATVRVGQGQVLTAAALLLRAPSGSWRASSAEIELVARTEAQRVRPRGVEPSLRAERIIVVPSATLLLPEARRGWVVRIGYPDRPPLVVILDAETARVIRAFSAERRTS